MTNALYDRIDAIESFAADVSHELKNPLTSLRSAVETLPRARTEEARTRPARCHPARRAPPRPADQRHLRRPRGSMPNWPARDAGPVGPAPPGGGFSSTYRGRSARAPRRWRSTSKCCPINAPRGRFVVSGHDLRIGQVLTNLIENARVLRAGDRRARVTLRLTANRDNCFIDVEGQTGPGISAEKIDSIFRRFYTDRPADEAFGQNSGLGLSISRADHRGAWRHAHGRKTSSTKGPARGRGGPLHRAVARASRHDRIAPVTEEPKGACRQCPRHRSRGGRDGRVDHRSVGRRQKPPGDGLPAGSEHRRTFLQRWFSDDQVLLFQCRPAG